MREKWCPQGLLLQLGLPGVGLEHALDVLPEPGPSDLEQFRRLKGDLMRRGGQNRFGIPVWGR